MSWPCSALLLAAQSVLIIGCAQTVRLSWDSPSETPRRPYPLLCGQPLAPKCQFQYLSFTQLPSRAPATELYSAAQAVEADPAGEAREPYSPQALLSLRSYQSSDIPEPIFALVRVARGYYGDSLETRLYAERVLVRRMLLWGDDGGAVDLAYLMQVDGYPVPERYAALAQHCLSGKMLDLLTRADLAPTFGSSSPKYNVQLAWLNLLSARGLVELGEYDEAREKFQQYSPQVPEPPDFVPQCMKWLEGRAEELTPVPVGRPCNCEIEPPKWREGCGCPPASHASEPAPPSPDSNRPVCDPGQREVPGGVIAVDEPCREK